MFLSFIGFLGVSEGFHGFFEFLRVLIGFVVFKGFLRIFEVSLGIFKVPELHLRVNKGCWGFLKGLLRGLEVHWLLRGPKDS